MAVAMQQKGLPRSTPGTSRSDLVCSRYLHSTGSSTFSILMSSGRRTIYLFGEIFPTLQAQGRRRNSVSSPASRTI